MPLKLTINSVATTVEVAPDTPLLWVLRDVLNYTGTKYGCGMGLCGACTVLVDGGRSLLHYAASAPLDSAITTIEGLSPDGSILCRWHGRRSMCRSADTARPGRSCLPPRCWRNTPHPTDAEIDTAMSGNLCRCGTYPRIRQAIHEAANCRRCPQVVGRLTP